MSPWQSLNVVLDLSLNLKLCDFGLTESMVGPGSLCPDDFASCEIGRQERTHITKKNNGGSPRYMAPEVSESKVWGFCKCLESCRVLLLEKAHWEETS